MLKTEIAELLASDVRAGRQGYSAADYAKRYTTPELLALVDAYGYADLYCREARALFDAVTWSRSLRLNKKLRERSEELTGRPAAILR